MGTEMKEEKKGKVGILKFWTWNFKCSLSCNTAHGIQDL